MRASRTTSEKARPGASELKMNERVPEKTPSTRRMRSPVSTRCFNVAITGKPAPTVAWVASVIREHVARSCLRSTVSRVHQELQRRDYGKPAPTVAWCLPQYSPSNELAFPSRKFGLPGYLR